MVIIQNPCEFVVLPKVERRDYRFYSSEQISTLLETIKDESFFPLIKVTVYYGLRRSELLGLQWDSIDFTANTITIKHTVSKVTKVIEKNRTKNISSHRTFPLLEEMKTIFLTAKEKEQENRNIFGNSYIENNYVFKWSNGKPYSPDYITHKFTDLLIKYHLEPIRFHDLRHSCASFLITKGFSLKDVQEWLGHADISTTANIYAHIDLERKKHIATTLESSF